jgi:hypothetical protein
MAAKDTATVRLRNVNSGAVVSVPTEKVDRLGAEWEPVEDPKPARKPTRSTASK